MNVLECDLVVIGGGMAGMSAAATAAESGAQVVVVEKAPDIGGSALISGGYLWTVPSIHTLRAINPGDLSLAEVVIDGFAEAMAWLRRREVVNSGPVAVVYGRGYETDILTHMNLCRTSILAAGGSVVTDTRVQHLMVEHGRVVGAATSHADGEVELRAPHTLLATGGLQGSPELRASFIHPNARYMVLRANPYSTGDGLLLATAAGSCAAGVNPGFYGHLLCYPAEVTPDRFRAFSQMHSEKSLLLGIDGRRFVDESLAYHINAQATVQQPEATGLLVWDSTIQEQVTAEGYVKGQPPVDRFEIAKSAGAHCFRGAALDELAAFATGVGFDGAQVRRTILEYNEKAKSAPEALSPPRLHNLRVFDAPPYFALVVKPAITFSHGGIRTDVKARALRPTGTPIDGLLVAGADVGDVYRGGYAGGLALALTFGRQAMRTAGWLN